MKLSAFLVLIVFGFTSAQVVVDPNLLIHCALTGCAGGAECDFETGVCDCATAGVTTGDTICIAHDPLITGCTSCGTLGTNTVDDGGTGSCLNADQCLCLAGWFGPTCEVPSIEVNCDTADAIVLSIGPHWYSDRSMFDGVIYLSDTNDFTTETLDNVDSKCRYTGHELLRKTIPGPDTDADCQIVVGATTDGERNVYAYIQFHPNFRTARDRIVSARCLTGGVVSGDAGTATVTDTQPGDRAPIESTTSTEDASGITMSLLAMDRSKTGADRFSPITSPTVVVGADLAVVLEGAVAFSVKTCWATNRVETDDNYDDKKSFYYMEDWCIPPAATVLLNGKVEGASNDPAAAKDIGAASGGSSGYALMTPINAFYFTGGVSNTMAVQCLVCIDPAACGGSGLTAPVCHNTLSTRDLQESLTGWVPGTRRRRDIVAEVQNATIAVSIKVVDYTGQSDGDINGEIGEGETADCYKSTSVLLPIILLAALLLVTMVMTFFFCMKVTRSQDTLQQSMGHENMSYKS